MRYHFTLAIIKKPKVNSVGENVEKLKPLYTVGRIVKWYSCYGTVWSFLKKLKIGLSHDPAIPLLSIHPKELKSGFQGDFCTSVFIVALFTIAKMWKQPKYPSTDEWIKKMWYIHTMEHYTAFKKERNSAIWDNMDEPWGHYTKKALWKSHHERQILHDFIYVRYRK